MSNDHDFHPALKVQLTRPALERLIGTDATMEMLLSDAAVKEVIQRHLKKALATVDTHIEKYVQESLSASFGKVVAAWGGKAAFAPAAAVNLELDKLIKPMVNKYVEQHVINNTKNIHNMIRDVVDSSLERLITTEVIKRVQGIIMAAAGEAIQMPPPK